jgi:hypothetical protein
VVGRGAVVRWQTTHQSKVWDRLAENKWCWRLWKVHSWGSTEKPENTKSIGAKTYGTREHGSQKLFVIGRNFLGDICITGNICYLIWIFDILWLQI